MPLWAIALGLILYPIRTGAVLLQRHHPYDPLTDTWTLHGARFSNRALQAMAGRVGEGHWYRFRREQPFDGIYIEAILPYREEQRHG